MLVGTRRPRLSRRHPTLPRISSLMCEPFDVMMAAGKSYENPTETAPGHRGGRAAAEAESLVNIAAGDLSSNNDVVDPVGLEPASDRFGGGDEERNPRDSTFLGRLATSGSYRAFKRMLSDCCHAARMSWPGLA